MMEERLCARSTLAGRYAAVAGTDPIEAAFQHVDVNDRRLNVFLRLSPRRASVTAVELAGTACLQIAATTVLGDNLGVALDSAFSRCQVPEQIHFRPLPLPPGVPTQQLWLA